MQTQMLVLYRMQGIGTLQIHQSKTAGIPQFIQEEAIRFDFIGGEEDITPLNRQGGERKAQSVRAVLLDDQQRIDDIPLGFAHLLPLLIAHKGVDVHILEGNFLHKLHPHHDHAGNPKKDNIKPRHQHRRGIVFLKLLGLIGPVHR